MTTTITIDDQAIDVSVNAFTPVLYRQIFRKDFLQEVTTFKDFIGKTASDFTGDELASFMERKDSFQRVAFVMTKQYEIKDINQLTKLSVVDYYAWLSDFSIKAFNEPETYKSILAAWKMNTKGGLVESKNTDRQE